MKKSELLAQLAPLGDDDEVIIGIITPAEDDGFELNDDDGAEDSAEAEDGDEGEEEEVDEIMRDIDVVDVRLNEEGEDGVTRNFAALIVDMTQDEDEDDEEDDSEEGTESTN